jgi:CSLREA domain-containing protein
MRLDREFRTLWVWAAACGVAALALLCVPPKIAAQPTITIETIVVNTLDDEDNNDGDCSCREAIFAANSNTVRDGCPSGTSSVPDSIVFDASLVGTIALTLGQLMITDDVIIRGSGGGQLSISGGNSSRVFNIQSGKEVEIFDLTITSGNAAGAVTGGAIHNAGDLTMKNCDVRGNQAGQGGGIHNAGGSLIINSSTISGNQADEGGGVSNGTNADMTIINSTISGNQAVGGAGAAGGGILCSGSGSTVASNNTTITDNSAAQGGGIAASDGGTVTIYSTIVGGNTASENGPDVSDDGGSGTLSSNGYNLIGDVEGATVAAGTEDQIGGDGNPVVDPLLEPLTDNGGPVATHLLTSGSPAIDTGDRSQTGLTVDQRGMPRPVDIAGLVNSGDGCDVGSLEVQSVIGVGGDYPRVADLQILGTYPNPFTLGTSIHFTAPETGAITVAVYDSRGALVQTLLNAEVLAGHQVVRWNGQDASGRIMSAGMYFCQIKGFGDLVSVGIVLVR